MRFKCKKQTDDHPSGNNINDASCGKERLIDLRNI